MTWEEATAVWPEQFNKRLKDRSMRGLRAWRYTKPLDIENTGKPVDVVLWQGHERDIPCGDAVVNWLMAEPSPPIPTWGFRSSVEPLVLDRKGTIDWDESRRVFGHPKGDEYTVSDSYAGPGFKRKFKKFRPIGPNIGIFEYKKAFYLDTFFDVWGDAEDSRRDDVQAANVLGVFLRRDGSLTQVCELRRKSTDIPLWHTYDSPGIGPN